MTAIQRTGFHSLYSLSNERFGSLLENFSLEELAKIQTISNVWHIKCIVSEPFIPRYLAPNVSYKLSQRCVIPRPVFNLGPMFPLKYHEILDPKKCFSIVLRINKEEVPFKLLYFSHATKHAIVKQHFLKLSVMIPRIGLKAETTILQFLDEISLHGGVSRVCKAWNYKTRLLPHPHVTQLRDLFTKGRHIELLRRSMLCPRTSIKFFVSLKSRKTRTFKITIKCNYNRCECYSNGRSDTITPDPQESIWATFLRINLASLAYYLHTPLPPSYR